MVLFMFVSICVGHSLNHVRQMAFSRMFPRCVFGRPSKYLAVVICVGSEIRQLCCNTDFEQVTQL